MITTEEWDRFRKRYDSVSPRGRNYLVEVNDGRQHEATEAEEGVEGQGVPADPGDYMTNDDGLLLRFAVKFMEGRK